MDKKKKQSKFTTGGQSGGSVMDAKTHPANAIPEASSNFGSMPTMSMDRMGGNIPEDTWKYSPDLHPYIGGS